MGRPRNTAPLTKLHRSALTRRSMLSGASAIVAGFVPGSLPAAPAVSSVTETLKVYMSGARERALPADVTEKMKLHILDTFAAMISGAELPPGKVMLSYARTNRGDQSTTIAASDVLCGPIEA